MKFIYLFIAFTSMACIPIKEKDIVKPEIPVVDDSSPKLIFLNINIVKETENKLRANLVNQIITNGSLKAENPEPAVKQKGDLQCKFFNNQSNAIDSFYIPNPLVKNIEYVDSAGAFDRKIVELDSVGLSLRMQLPADTKLIFLETIEQPVYKLLEIEL